MGSSSRSTNFGQVVEYIPDRLYLGAYIRPPTADTYFPRSKASIDASPSKRSDSASQTRLPPCYFSVDEILLYNAFHDDFGPWHIGHLYRFALEFHEILGAKENKNRPIVFWSRADSRSRANAACLLACYMVLVQNWAPHLALAPIAQIDPPLMPFRDAGYSRADYGISVQDVVYGVWKAREEGCCALNKFDLDEYERFERVEHGDFNWLTPSFVAFASPQHDPVARIVEGSEEFPLLPRDLAAVDSHPTLPAPFRNVLRHFSERNVGLVVRLNSALYSPSYFEALGIQHLDMIFDDGTCPPLTTVRKFIRIAHETIAVRKKAIAVHCKAGLGRTGCLIGAYLIYRHGFTADEVIAFMRFMRPGMVVGPQQHWLHLNQGTFREWWVEERVERRLRKEMAVAAAAAAAAATNTNTATATATATVATVVAAALNPAPSTPIRAMQKTSIRASQASTPRNRSPSNRTPLSEVERDRNNIGAQEDYLPAPTPGQPRKTYRANADRHHPYSRAGSQRSSTEEKTTAGATTEAVSAGVSRRSGAETDEDWKLRVRAQRKAAATQMHQALSSQSQQQQQQQQSHSPERSPDRYSQVSHVVQTAAASIYRAINNDSSNDTENLYSSGRVKAVSTADRAGSASGVMAKVRSARRHVEVSPLRAKDAGVRKTSGRIGSIGSGAAGAPSHRKASVS